MCRCCPLLELISDVDFETNIAHFTLGSSFSCIKIKIESTAIVNLDSGLIVEENVVCLHTNRDGEFEVELSPNTESIKFLFKLCFSCKKSHKKCIKKSHKKCIKKSHKKCIKKSHKKCIKIVKCYPPESEIELNQSNLLLRTTMQNCNTFAIDASGYDHANAKEQLGPCRASRAMAIVHIAMFEAFLAIVGGYQSYLPTPPIALVGSSVEAAIAQATHDTLLALFPAQTSRINAQLVFDLSNIPNGPSKTNGIAVGASAAAATLALRASDGANSSPVFPETTYADYILANPVGSTPGLWTQDPISNIPIVLGYKWDLVEPFVMSSSSQFRCPPLPLLTSGEYTVSFDEVKALGGDGIITPTVRSEEMKNVGIYWAYDGVPNLCAPPRLYNQIAMILAIQEGLDNAQMFRLLALLNIAMADAGIASWESKYYYKFWRPVTGIRETHRDGTPAPDGNASTVPDPTYTPLGAPATNNSGVDFTPPFPAYPSGHATFGGALFQTLRNVLGRDNIAFTFVSDELNGVTEDSQGNVRPLLPRSFTSLSQAEEENAQSRMYLGIHWSFDKLGTPMGNQIANLVNSTVYLPL